VGRFQSTSLKFAATFLVGSTILLLCGGWARAASIRVSPGQVCPGQTVLLRVGIASFRDPAGISVTIGDRIAPVVRLVDLRTVEVLVPKLPRGKADIELEYKQDTWAKGIVTIVPPPLRRVFLRMENDSTVTVERVRPFNGKYDRSATRGRRISYDVISGRGQLRYTAAVPHPDSGTVEVFGPPGDESPFRVRARAPYRFMIKLPYSKDDLLVKIYEARDGVDLLTPEGRRARRLIKEFTVADKPEAKQKSGKKP